MQMISVPCIERLNIACMLNDALIEYYGKESIINDVIRHAIDTNNIHHLPMNRYNVYSRCIKDCYQHRNRKIYLLITTYYNNDATITNQLSLETRYGTNYRFYDLPVNTLQNIENIGYAFNISDLHILRDLPNECILHILKLCCEAIDKKQFKESLTSYITKSYIKHNTDYYCYLRFNEINENNKGA